MANYYRIKGVDPLDRQHGTFPKRTVPEALRDALFGAGGHCYALLDAAKIPDLPDSLARSGLQHLCLFKGRALEEAGTAAPWIVRLDEAHAFTRSLFTQGKGHWQLWDDAAGIFLRSAAPIESMQAHLRQFTRLPDQTGAWYYFRYWEPAVAATYFATFDARPDLAGQWFAPRQGAPLDAIVVVRPDLRQADVFAYDGQPEGRAIHLLTQQDIDLFARARTEADCDKLAANLRQTFGPEITIPDAALRDFTRHAVQRLTGLGFCQRDTLSVMLAWELFFGPQFENMDPDLSRIMHSDRDEAERFEALKDRMAQL